MGVVFSPTSSVQLLKGVNLTPSYTITKKFSSLSEQEGYFSAKVFKTYSDFTFIKKESYIIVGDNIENINICNYVRYKNKSKWYYCFITDMEYLNDNTTKIFINTDVMQTYKFDFSVNECFVEREQRDFSVQNFVAENLDIGNEYVIESITKIASFNRCFIICSTSNLEDNGQGGVATGVIQGTYASMKYYVVNDSNYSNIFNQIDRCVGVASIMCLPFTPSYEGTEVNIYAVAPSGDKTAIGKATKIKSAPKHFANIGSIPSIVNPSSYSKLNMYPFRYGLLTDGQCEPMMVKFELLKSNTVNCIQSINFPPRTRYIIDNYNNDNRGLLLNITNNQINDIPLAHASYVDYVNSSKAQLRNNLVGSALGVVGGLATQNPYATGVATSGVISSISAISSHMAKIQDLQAVPSTIVSHGNNVPFDINANVDGLYFYQYGVRPEIRTRIEKYFDNFGYQVNEFKVPFQGGYVKTSNCTISTDNINARDVEEIENIYNRGIKFI